MLMFRWPFGFSSGVAVVIAVLLRLICGLYSVFTLNPERDWDRGEGWAFKDVGLGLRRPTVGSFCEL